MSKVVLGILTGILIFIAAGILATYWVGKMRHDLEQRKPQVAMRPWRTQANTLAQPQVAGREPFADRLARKQMELRWSKRCL